MRDFPSAELYIGFHAVAFLQETDGISFFEIVIVIVRIRTEFDFFYLHDVLFLFGGLLFLLLLVLIMAEIYGSRDRRYLRGRDQHEIETHLLCLAQRGRGRHHLVCAIGKDGTNLARTNGFVHIFSTILPARRKISGRIHLQAMRYVRRGTLQETQDLVLPMVRVAE
jgi:hypothetical protein